MRNITVAVSDGAYRRARVWAAQHDTSISAVVGYCIEHLPGMPVAQQAVASLKSNSIITQTDETANSDFRAVKL